MNLDDIRGWLVGPLTAMATPFTDDYKFDCDALRTNVRFQVEHGMRTGDGALLVAAGAGEYTLMSTQERKTAMTEAMDAADMEVPVLTSINHPDFREIVTFAQHAERVGIAAVQLAPVDSYGTAEGDIYRVYEHVSRESRVPIMVYHTWWSGGHFSDSLLDDLMNLPTVYAIKWSSDDTVRYMKGIKAFRDVLVVCDNQGDRVLNHMLGGRSFVNHVGNIWPEYVIGVWRLLQKEDYAGALAELSRFEWEWDDWEAKVMQETGGHGSYLKAAMAAVGLKAGPPRPPATIPSGKLLDELKDLLERCGVPAAYR